MSRSDAVAQIKSGFRKGGAWLLGIGWLALVFKGIRVALTPSKYPPFFGWIFLGIAALVLIFTMDKWVRIFPGLLRSVEQRRHANRGTRTESSRD